MGNIEKKVLITGASGFIGSFLVEGGLDRGMNMWAGIRPTSSREYLTDTRIRFAELDLANPERLKEQLALHKQLHGGWDCIVHCAGITKCHNRDGFDKGNYVATRNLVEILQTLDMVPGQFIYISSLSVFGPVHERDYTTIGEQDVPCPNTAYGMSKLKTERYLQGLYNFPWVIFRPTGVYGPRECDYFLMAKSIKRHLDLTAGLKRQDLTFVYVKDLVQAVYLAIRHEVKLRTYFVSDGRVYDSRTFSDLIQKELGSPWVVHIKCPLFMLKTISVLVGALLNSLGRNSTLNRDKYKIMKQRNWRCDIMPLIDELDYHPEYLLEKGVKETIAWYKKEGWL